VGTQARLNQPAGLAFSNLDSNVLYFCDSYNHCIRKVNILTRQDSTIARASNQLGCKDGVGAEAIFNTPRGICVDKKENLYICDLGNHSIRKITLQNQSKKTLQDQKPEDSIVSTLFGEPGNEGIKDGGKSVATLKFPHSIFYDSKSNSLLFTQWHAVRRIKLKRNFLEWKLTKIFLIYRILFKQCEKSTSKRILLQLISLQILQISSSDENSNNDDNQNYQWQQKNNDINKMLIEKQNKITEYIKSNSNLANTSKSNLLDTLFSLHIQN
jgi:hypothetical protein